jgi:hypothetical protein
MNVGDETTTTQMILDLTKYTLLTLRYNSVVLAMTLEPYLVCRRNCCNGCGSLIDVHCSNSTC